MTTNSFLDHAAEYVYKELERGGGDPTKLEVPLQTIAVLYTVQAMIDNGGFRYVFESDFPFCPPYSVFSDAYRRIGAFDAADCLDKAVAMFPFEKPHQCQEERNAFMDSLDESHEMFELGNKVCGDQTIWSALEGYAEKNAGFFHIT